MIFLFVEDEYPRGVIAPSLLFLPKDLTGLRPAPMNPPPFLRSSFSSLVRERAIFSMIFSGDWSRPNNRAARFASPAAQLEYSLTLDFPMYESDDGKSLLLKIILQRK